MKFRDKALKFVVITKVPDILDPRFGNATDEFVYKVTDRDSDEKVSVAGHSSFLNVWTETDHNGATLFVKVKQFHVGDILVCEDHGGFYIEVGRGRKPYKWLVEYEVFDDIIEALEKARSLE